MAREFLTRIDSRKRLNLRAVAPCEHYSLRVDDDGVITLTPVVVMTVTEAAALRGEKGNAA